MEPVDRSPFEYVRPLEGEAVSGREQEIDRLVGLARERRPVAVVAPRRFGKTSLLAAVSHMIGEVDTTETVWVDLFGLASLADAAAAFERAMGGLRRGARKAAGELFAGSELGFSLQPGLGFKARMGDRNAPSPEAAFAGLLDVLVAVSARQRGLLLVIDEFQDIARVDGLDARLRSRLQHARDLAVLFAGSQPSMMRELFTDVARPFYSQAEIFELGGLDPEAAVGIVVDGFVATGRTGDAVAEEVVAFVGGHPQRLMLLADRVWRSTAPGGTAGPGEYASGLDATRDAVQAELVGLFSRLPGTQRDVVRAVAQFGSPFARAAERQLDLRGGSASTAADRLIAGGLLVRDPQWRLVDPFFTDWLVRRFGVVRPEVTDRR